MTFEEMTKARFEGLANVVAFMLADHLKSRSDREIEIIRDLIATPHAPLAEAEVDPEASARQERRQVMRDTSDLIVDRALDFLGRRR